MEAELESERVHDEIERLKQLLEESNSARERAHLQAEQALTAAADDKAELEHLHKKLKSFREDASRFSREDDRKIRVLEREKQESEKKIARLKSEVAELRSVIEEYVSQIKSGLEGSSESALITELDLVRKQAETDVARMREQIKALEREDSAGEAVLDSLRRQVESLQQSEREQQQLLAEAESERQQLRQESENQRAELKQLQHLLAMAKEEMEKVEVRRRDQLEVRKQLEASLDEALQELVELRKGGDSSTIDFSQQSLDRSASQSSKRQKIVAGFFGALAAFALAESISIFSGRGELITGTPPNKRPETEFDFPRLEKSKSMPPQFAEDINQKMAVVAATADTDSKEQPQREVILQQPDNRPATGTTLRDQLKIGVNGPVMTYIRGATFNMGQRHDQLATDERPLHAVKLKSFAIGKYEVTFREYLLFAKATGRKIPSDQGWGGDQRPVINISWKDAADYARWLSAQTGVNYRLPTEAEWEYAASGGMESFYWWGFELGENRASCFDCGSRWDGKSTAPVGSFPANPFLLNDTAGNVMEWVADCYHHSYRGAPVDGSAWLEPNCTQYVARGGAYNKPGDSLHTVRRFSFQIDTRLPILGFRVARDVE